MLYLCSRFHIFRTHPAMTTTSSHTATTAANANTLPDPRETDLVMKASYERQLELLRTTVKNLSTVSQEQEICNNLLKKENADLRQQLADAQDPEHESSEVVGLKIRIYAMRDLLAVQGISQASTDRAKLARYIAFMLGSTERYVERILDQDRPLTDAHRADIERYNQLSRDIKLDIS